MLFERQRAVKCYSEIDWEAVVFQFLAIPLDVELIVSLVIVKVEGTHLSLGRVRIERVFFVIFREGFQGLSQSSFNGFEALGLRCQAQVISVYEATYVFEFWSVISIDVEKSRE